MALSAASSIEQIELSSTLSANISDTATTITLSPGDGASWLPSNNSYILIEKINSETGRYEKALLNLEKLTEICVFNCDEKIELSEAISKYESENNL